MERNKIKALLGLLGPGLLFAGAAIGVSHVVQATRAGALYGWSLLWVIPAIHLVKYPFFQFGPRYVAATGESLLEGYQRLGQWVLVLFLLFTLGTVFTIQAAVTVVTAGILSYLTGITAAPWLISGCILAFCALILVADRFLWLERAIKWVIVLLAIATITAFLTAFSEGPVATPGATFDWAPAGIAFLLALMGWMPSPLDLSVWLSVWNKAKNATLHHRQSLRHTLLDFNIGYWGTMLVAIFFLGLGAMVMHHSGAELSPKGAQFAGQLISVYTATLGTWMHWIIGLAALATMFSTTLTVLDGIPRVLADTTRLLWPRQPFSPVTGYRIYLLMVVGGALFILGIFINSMQSMVNLATILSFLTAPFIAIVNYTLINQSFIPRNYRPPLWLHIMSFIGILFFLGFSVWYIYVTWW